MRKLHYHSVQFSIVALFISDEYLHILLNIYLFIYLIHFGDGDREIVEASKSSW